MKPSEIFNFDWENESPSACGEFIQDLRKQSDWSITDIQNRLHVDRRTVTRWLSGASKAPYSAMKLLFLESKKNT